MAETKVIFNRNIINKNIESFNYGDLSKKNEIIKKWINFENSGVLDKTKETALQTDFLNDFFGEILGYKSTLESSEEWTLDKETKTKADETRADGALGFFSQKDKDIKVVIELKDSKTKLDERQTRLNDRRTPIEQAFSYASKSGKSCNWVIVSNYKEIRLYNAKDYNEYEVFYIKELSNEIELKRFIFMLTNKNLISKEKESLLDVLYRKNIEAEEEISKKFYSDYKKFRMNLFNHIKEKNPNINEILIFEKTQKLIDRFIFVCFCEDTALLDEKTIRKLVEVARKRLSRSNTKIWAEMKDLFLAIDLGSPEHNINRFNGGLFAEDNIIDNFTIEDDIFEELALISDYDFASDLNVNILGHIFEQSLNDIEEIKASLSGENFDEKKGKRKKDGIFYTPEYITKYIVKEAIGSWLEDRKIELGFYVLPELTEEDKKVKYKNKKSMERVFSENTLKHMEFWENYKEKLKKIKVLDPACGSGAFLNQAFDYLKVEGERVNDELASLRGIYSFEDLSVGILKNNIFGVDLNEESVEITKLSLWLKTAKKTDPLTSLDENIKCGNSLIDDESIAGEKAFKWEIEFKEIMDNGGFDVVIGNPPYVQISMAKSKNSYIKFKTISCGDLYALFFEKGINLLKETGYLGFITPSLFIKGIVYSSLREYLISNIKVMKIEDKGDGVFEDVQMPTAITILKNEYCDNQLWDSFLTDNEIMFKMQNKVSLISDLSKIMRGLEFGKDRIEENGEIDLITGEDIERYSVRKIKKISREVYKEFEKDNYYFSGNRILIRETGNRITSTYLENPLQHTRSLYSIKLKTDKINYKYLLAILNSSLIQYFYKIKFAANTNIFPKIRIVQVKELPIKIISIENQVYFSDKTDDMINLNKELLSMSNKFNSYLSDKYNLSKVTGKIQEFYLYDFNELLKELKKQKITLQGMEEYSLKEIFDNEKKNILEIKENIEKTDKEIDKMVYELYGLTEDEIKLVEESV